MLSTRHGWIHKYISVPGYDHEVKDEEESADEGAEPPRYPGQQHILPGQQTPPRHRRYRP